MKWMINCHESTMLSVKKDEIGISWLDKLRLLIHFKLCIVCKYFDDQIKKIDTLLIDFQSVNNNKMSSKQKQKLKEYIKSSI